MMTALPARPSMTTSSRTTRRSAPRVFAKSALPSPPCRSKLLEPCWAVFAPADARGQGGRAVHSRSMGQLVFERSEALARAKPWRVEDLQNEGGYSAQQQN